MAWFTDNAPAGNRYNPGSPMQGPMPVMPPGGTPYQAVGGDGGQLQQPQTTGTGSGGVDPNNPLFQGINPQLVNYFVTHGITPTGPGTGPTDIAYLNEKMTAPGQDIGYWLNEKLPNQVFGGGGGGGGGGFGSSTAPSAFQPTAFTGTPYQPPQFQAPTGLNYMNDPGYLARMQMGESAIQNAAAAKGSLLSGGTLKALERYGQDYGSNEFGNVFNRALTGYGANVAAGQQGFQNQLTALGQQNMAGQQGYLNRYGQFTDYLGQINQAADRGLRATQGLYQPTGIG